MHCLFRVGTEGHPDTLCPVPSLIRHMCTRGGFRPDTEYPDPGWVTARQCGQLTPIDLIVEERFHRAAPGGMGGTKAAGNYSPV